MITEILENFRFLSIQCLFTLFKYSYNTYSYFKKAFKKVLKNNIDIINIETYNTFQVMTYQFIKDDFVYVFDFIVKNKEIDTNKLINLLLEDTNDNIKEKDKNKNLILHASIIESEEIVLCEITEELRKLRYYFNSHKEFLINNELKSAHLLYWRDLLEIIEIKYKKKIDPTKVYLYIIYNNNALTEKTILLSSYLDTKIRF
jgi:hypothetical protein